MIAEALQIDGRKNRKERFKYIKYIRLGYINKIRSLPNTLSENNFQLKT